MSISEQEIRLRVILEDLKAKSDITDLELELKRLHELGETKIKLKYDKDGNLERVISQLKSDSGAIVDYVRRWNAEAKKLEQVSATVSYNFEQAARSQEQAAKSQKQATAEAEKTGQALAKATSNASAEIAAFKEKVTTAFNGMWEGFTPKKMDVTIDPDGKALRAVVQLTDGVGKLVTGTAVLDKETGVLTTSTYKLSENFEKEQRAANDASNANQTAAESTRATANAAELASGSVGLLTSGNNNLVRSTRIVGEAAEEAGIRTEEAGRRTEEAGRRAEKSGKAFTLLHTIFLRLAHTAISAVTRAFREALTEMKNVDSELVVVRKVSDATSEELSALKERAYEVGAAYGILASDYLNAAAEMTRAGYREQAGDLAELATKLQLVGDVSQDVANQFLIATDKSYKMNGNYQKLSETIDKLNEIDNNFATSFEKVADGIGLLAPVAAQANVSFDEMAAAIGTVTAVTQRSGTESARALRSLFLNIIKDTSTEIEDGVTWTVDEVNSLSDALKKYAPDVVKAAEATGELINPMEAVGALAQSYKEGLLTNQDLFDIVSGLGGKLRTSQLLALIQNWDMYNEMLEKTANAAGSADKEVSNALDSWDVKLNQLKNTFTQFTQSILNSEEIKGFIDSIKFLLMSIDDPDEYGELFAETLEKSFRSLVSKLPKFQESINSIFITVLKGVLPAISENLPEILKSLGEGATEATRELANNFPEIFGNIAEIIIEAIASSIIDGNLAQNISEAIVTGIVKSIPNVLTKANDGLYKAFEGREFSDGLKDFLVKRGGVIGKGIELFDTLKKLKDAKEGKLNLTNSTHHRGSGGSFKDVTTENNRLTDDNKKLADSYESVESAIEAATNALKKYKNALDNSVEKGDAFKSYAEAFKTATEMYGKGLVGTNAYMSAVDLLFGSGIVDTYEEAGELLGNKFIKAMFEGGGDDFGANAANYIREHINEFEGVSVKMADDGTFSVVVDDMKAFAESAQISEGAIGALLDALDAYDSKELDGTIKTVGDFTDEKHEIELPVKSNVETFFESLDKNIKAYDGRTIHINLSAGSTFGGSSSSGGTGLRDAMSTPEEILGSRGRANGVRKDNGGLSLINEDGAELIYANGKAWIAGGGEPTITNLPQGAGVFNAKETREILTRSGIRSFDDGLTASNIPTTTISNLVQVKSVKNGQSLSKTLKQLQEYIDQILKKAKEALKAQIDAIDAQIEKLKREHDAQEDANKLEELRLKILEAEKRLAEAENERTVRYFNKDTGQWEWMADQKAVEDARKALQEARDEYNKEVAEQAYQAQIQALEDQKDSLNKAYDDLEDKWKTILEALEGKKKGKSTDVTKLLESLGSTAGKSGASNVSNFIKEIDKFLKNTSTPIDSDTFARIMSTQGSTGSSSTSVLSALLGSSAYDLNSKGNSIYSSNASTIVGDTIYYINGVHIGNDMMDKPLSQILSVLPIYAN